MDQQLTLYLGLEEDSRPDLAVVAKAAIAFDAAIRDIAFVIDPSISVRVELDSGTPGSLKLNSILKTIKGKVADKQTLKAVALVVIGWFAQDVRSYISEQLIETVIREEVDHSLSDEDIQKIAELVAKALNGKVGREHIQKVYEELERDGVIDGVGVTTNPDKKPRVIVPRTEFIERSGAVQDIDLGPEFRDKRTKETLILISPVLIDAKRKWKFSTRGVEFGATIEDHDFLEDLLTGQQSIEMVAGITMDVELDTREERIDGVWTVKDRVISRVIRTGRAQQQTELKLSPEDQPKGNKAEDK